MPETWTLIKCHDHLWARLALNWIEFFAFVKSDPVIQTACQKEAYPESFINLGQPGPKVVMTFHSVCMYTSHSAYVATETELVGAKIDGLLPPNFL